IRARSPGAVQRLGGNTDGSPGGYPTGARRVLPQPLRFGLCLLRRPGLCEDGAHTVLGPGGQRRGASLPDLRGDFKADPELRVRLGVEDGCGADLGQGPHQGVLRKTHTGRAVARHFRPGVSGTDKSVFSGPSLLGPAVFAVIYRKLSAATCSFLAEILDS